MDALARARTVGDLGVATAEYATCGVAATGFGALLYRFLMSPRVQDGLLNVIGWMLRLPG